MDKLVEDGSASKLRGKKLRRGNSLKASLGYSFAGQAFYLVSQLGILSSLAHFHGPAAVGEFGLALAFTTPLFLLLNMGFRTAQAVDVGEDFSFAEYGGTRLILTILATAICVAIGALYSEKLSTFLVILFVTIAKSFESVSNLAYGAFQQVGRMDLVARSFALRGTITLVIFVLLLVGGADTATALMAQMVVWAIIGLLLDYPHASRLMTGKFVFPRWSLRDSWRLFCHSAPLGGGVLANSLQMTVTRLMVERFLSIDALGLFTAVAYFQQAGVTASNSVSNAIVNRLARLIREGQRGKLRQILVRLLLSIVLIGAVGVAISYFFGDVILMVLFGHSYLSAAPLLFITAIAVSLRMISTVPQSMLFAERRFKEFFGFQVATLALSAALGYFLIPRYGILGAGYVLLAAALFRLVVLEFVLLLMPRKHPVDIKVSSEDKPNRFSE